MSAMSNRVRLYLVSVASLGWAVSFGLLSSLAPLTMQDAGESPSTIGLNTSLYYLGVAAASPVVPLLMRYGRWCVMIGMALDAATTMIFPIVSGAMLWHVVRFVGGVGTALSLIPMETLVNHHAPKSHRASNFGFYAFCVACGLAIGSGLGLPLYPLTATLPYFLAATVTLVATGLAWVAMPANASALETVSEGHISWWNEAFCFATAWVQGFLEGGTFAFLTLYLLGRGASESFAAILMSGLFVGVIIAQLPLGYVADRIGLKRSVAFCLMALLTGLAMVPFAPLLVLVGILFVLGASCGALYPLGLALLGERVPSSALSRANAYYLMANCVGSLSGPLLIGLAVEKWGLTALFSIGAIAVMVVLGILPTMGGRTSTSAESLRQAA